MLLFCPFLPQIVKRPVHKGLKVKREGVRVKTDRSKKKRKTSFPFAFCSLIHTFAPKVYIKKYEKGNVFFNVCRHLDDLRRCGADRL